MTPQCPGPFQIFQHFRTETCSPEGQNYELKIECIVYTKVETAIKEH